MQRAGTPRPSAAGPEPARCRRGDSRSASGAARLSREKVGSIRTIREVFRKSEYRLGRSGKATTFACGECFIMLTPAATNVPDAAARCRTVLLETDERNADATPANDTGNTLSFLSRTVPGGHVANRWATPVPDSAVPWVSTLSTPVSMSMNWLRAASRIGVSLKFSTLFQWFGLYPRLLGRMVSLTENDLACRSRFSFG